MRFFFQVIVNADLKTIYGVEVLTKIKGELPQPDHDPVIVSCACLLASIFHERYGSKYKVHVNAFPESMDRIDWKVVERVKTVLRVEVIEREITPEVKKKILSLCMKREIPFFLDDFGTKMANFDVLRIPWTGIKVDALCVPKRTAETLKERFFVIAEKTHHISYPAHAYQSYFYHKPEPMSQISKIFEKLPSWIEEEMIRNGERTLR